VARVTIKDIARTARVTPTTVSNVINGRHARVSKKTIQHVRQVVAHLGYTPNQTARSLVSSVSKLVGVLIPFTEDRNKLLLDNPFYGEMVSGIESSLRANGYHMMLAGIDEGNIDLAPFLQWNVDALIVLGVYQDLLYSSVRSLDLPTLLIDSYVRDDHFFNLRLDDKLAAHQATTHLIDNGHRRISFVAGAIREDGVIARRHEGYRAALSERGIAYDPDLVFTGSVSFDYGKKVASAIASDPSITAAFCAADLIATGLMSGLQMEGRRIPEDISVMGFDNISIGKMLYPALTTVDQGILARGESAGSLITSALAGQAVPKDMRTPTTIIERASVATIGNARRG